MKIKDFFNGTISSILNDFETTEFDIDDYSRFFEPVFCLK